MLRLIFWSVCSVLTLVAEAQFGLLDTAFRANVPRPFTVALEDLDGDADQDVLVNDWDSLYWFENDGAGTFPQRHMIDGCYRGPVATPDIDNDGDADIAVCGDAWPWDADYGWYANDGAGHFTPMSLVAPWMDVSFSPVWSDLDGDGDVDLVARGDSTVRIRINNAGVFTDGPGLGDGNAFEPISIGVNDADNDGDNDVLVFGTAITERGYYENLGAGTFAAQVLIPVADDDALATIWDKDGDGDDDILLYTRWLINDGAAQYTAGDTLGEALPGELADADADGDPDFFWLTDQYSNVWEGRNDGDSIAAIEIEQVNDYTSVHDLSVGDINGDGHLDVLMCNQRAVLGWYAGDGANQWSVRHTIGSPLSGALCGVAADLDLDGDMDIATSGMSDDRFAWYPNDGTGQLGPQLVIADNMHAARDLVVLDLELDGDSDLVLWCSGDSTVVRARNNGLGQFIVDTLAVQPGQLAAADLNGDTYPDLVAGDAWYANDGNGDLTLLADLGSVYIYDAACGDVDGDGQADIVYASYDIRVIKGIAGGAYTEVISSTPNASNIALADLDLDGDLDVASIFSGNNNYWFENDGTGTFTEHLWYTAPFTMGATDLMAEDVTGDGAPDLVWAQGNNNGWVYLAQNDGQGNFGPSPTISSEASYALGLADMDGDLVNDLWNIGGSYIFWQRNHFFDAFRMRGTIFQDSDLDAVFDAGEPVLPFQLVRNDANAILVWTNSNGEYDLPADTGTWHVWAQHAAIYEVTNDPDTLAATLTTAEPIADSLDLGFAPATLDTSAFLGLYSNGNLLQCNANATVWVTLQNISTFIPHDILIDVFVHPDLTVNSLCSPPDSIADDHYYWHVDSLGWFQQWSTCLHVTTGPIGSNSTISATATYITAMPLIFHESIGGIIPCAFDPNDKLVTPQGYGAAGAVPIDQDHLTYSIRFQNTGTDTALNVVIRDLLDEDLRWESMQILAVSHPLTAISVDESGLATFRFDHILLPDSNVNEPASHGFITYRLETAPGAPHGTEIHNTASIFFDLNAPVVTNTVMNTLVDCELFSATITLAGVDSLVASAGDAWQWFLDGDSLIAANGSWLIVDAPGDYTVQVTSNYGCVALSDPYQMINTSASDAGHMSVTLWPDPARDHLFVQVPGPAIRAWILDPTGRALRTVALVPGRNTIPLQGMGAGTYTLRCDSGEVLRFIKQ